MGHSVGTGIQRYQIVNVRAGGRICCRSVIALAWAASLGLLVGLAPPAAANELSPSDPALSGLRDFVQSIAVDDASYTANRAADVPAGGGDAFTALRDFTRIIETEQSVTNSGTVKVAEADNAFDALREFLQKGSAGDQPKSPKAIEPKPAAKAPKPAAPPIDATYVGSKACAGCHTAHIAAFSETVMGKLSTQGKKQCETCHGPGSAHVKAGGGRGVGGIISFRIDDPTRTTKENNAICLGCHERGDRTYWSGSVHETRDVACANCHIVMKRVSAKFNLKTVFEPDTCFQCHKDRRAQMFRSSHMPLREGKIVCSDCHNPHGSFTEALLRTNTINENCYKCHAEKRGPYLFEHMPVRENCVNCHDPHGSVNEYMLKISRPRLCAECHTFDHGPQIANGPLVVQAFGRACQNCHTQVHGSNSPSGALLLR